MQQHPARCRKNPVTPARSHQCGRSPVQPGRPTGGAVAFWAAAPLKETTRPQKLRQGVLIGLLLLSTGSSQPFARQLKVCHYFYLKMHLYTSILTLISATAHTGLKGRQSHPKDSECSTQSVGTSHKHFPTSRGTKLDRLPSHSFMQLSQLDVYQVLCFTDFAQDPLQKTGAWTHASDWTYRLFHLLSKIPEWILTGMNFNIGKKSQCLWSALSTTRSVAPDWQILLLNLNNPKDLEANDQSPPCP